MYILLLEGRILLLWSTIILEDLLESFIFVLLISVVTFLVRNQCLPYLINLLQLGSHIPRHIFCPACAYIQPIAATWRPSYAAESPIA